MNVLPPHPTTNNKIVAVYADKGLLCVVKKQMLSYVRALQKLSGNLKICITTVHSLYFYFSFLSLLPLMLSLISSLISKKCHSAPALFINHLFCTLKPSKHNNWWCNDYGLFLHVTDLCDPPIKFLRINIYRCSCFDLCKILPRKLKGMFIPEHSDNL